MARYSRPLYSVYDHKTGMPILVGVTAAEICDYLGIGRQAFYARRHYYKSRKNPHLDIISDAEMFGDDDYDEDDECGEE